MPMDEAGMLFINRHDIHWLHCSIPLRNAYYHTESSEGSYAILTYSLADTELEFTCL